MTELGRALLVTTLVAMFNSFGAMKVASNAYSVRPMPASQCNKESEDLNLAPVCGTHQNKTYPNEWAFNCSTNYFSPEMKHFTEGPCEVSPEVDYCSMAWMYENKVCGTDNKTYHNYWNLLCDNKARNSNVEVFAKGECNISCDINLVYAPVCATHGITYANKEMVACMKLMDPYNTVTVEAEGACEAAGSSEPCASRQMKFNHQPICASNGISYGSVEEARCARTLRPDLKVLHNGECTAEDMMNAIVDKRAADACEVAIIRPVWAPVCGSDGHNYSNPFHLTCVAENESSLKLASFAECGANETSLINECGLPRRKDFYSYGPSVMPHHNPYEGNSIICASNGVTYTNATEFNCFQQKHSGVYVQRFEACKEEDDPCYMLKKGQQNFAQPVCATDGITYANMHSFWCALKTKPDLEMFHNGQCL